MSLIRIIDARRRFLLRVDEDQYLKTSQVVLTPIGGHPRIHADGAKQLAALGITLADNSTLSFGAPANAYEPLRQWFDSRRGRELDAMKLFEFQLCESPFYRQPLGGLKRDRMINARRVAHRRHTRNQGAVSLTETLHFTLTKLAMERLAGAVSSPDFPLYFAEAQEIHAQLAFAGIAISPLAGMMLDAPVAVEEA